MLKGQKFDYVDETIHNSKEEQKAIEIQRCFQNCNHCIDTTPSLFVLNININSYNIYIYIYNTIFEMTLH